jgi:hypothetical protein
MTSQPRQGRKSIGRARRVGLLTGLSGLVAALAVVLAPAAAHASSYCPEVNDLGDSHMVDEHNDLRVVHILSASDVFNTVQSFNFNNQSSPVPFTVQQAATQSTTFTLSNTDTLSTEQTSSLLKDGLTTSNKTTLSFSITATFTTTTGQTTTTSVSVPANGRIQLDRGVDTIDTVYNLDTWEISQGRCWYLPAKSPHNVFAKVPTTVEAWRTLFYPIVNPVGVVNPQTNSANDIHSDTTVSIYGLGFLPPTDRVFVQPATGGQVVIQAGSTWWWDLPGQINATLPGLPTGQASLYVVSTSPTGALLQSNTVSFFIG